jgi:hypothetical protein
MSGMAYNRFSMISISCWKRYFIVGEVDIEGIVKLFQRIA